MYARVCVVCMYTWDCEQETSNYSRIFVLEVSMRRERTMNVAWTWTGKWYILYYIKWNRYCLNKIDIHNLECTYYSRLQIYYLFRNYLHTQLMAISHLNVIQNSLYEFYEILCLFIYACIIVISLIDYER